MRWGYTLHLPAVREVKKLWLQNKSEKDLGGNRRSGSSSCLILSGEGGVKWRIMPCLMNYVGCMTQEDIINALLKPELNQQGTEFPAGEDGSVCLRFRLRRKRRRQMRCITHLLSYPIHHDCPTQPCFHTLTMRVKACTHGCLWATSVTSLSRHTLGLKQKQWYKYLRCQKVFYGCMDGRRGIYDCHKKCCKKKMYIVCISVFSRWRRNACEGFTCYGV